MKGFKSYSGCRVGASHVAKNMNCEDFAAAYDGEGVSIAVISDGHGDKKCFRSAQGAHIACNVAIECVKRLIDSSSSACDVLKKSPDRIITELEREIIREWNKGVEDDLNTNKITDNELEGVPEDAIEAIHSGHSLNKIYGCTLIMCVVLEDFWFGIHIGDGKCVVAMDNGLYTQPIPWDEEGCVGNRSTSVCNSNSFASFRYAYGIDVPIGLFVASDGVDESFDESGLNRCYYTLGYWVQTMSKNELDSKMDELLSQITNNGSGDDVSIACILSDTNEIKKPYASSEQVADKLKELIENIKDKEMQFDDLTESKREVSNSLGVLKSEIEDLKKKIAMREEQIIDKKQELANIDSNLQQVITQLQKSVIQLPRAKDTKEHIDQYWRENGVDIKEDAELDYIPKYSEEYLGAAIAEIEKSNKKDLSESDEEKSGGIESDITLVKHDSNPAIDEKSGFESKTDIVTIDKIDVSAGAFPADSDRQIVDKNEQVSEESEAKSQKNGFFWGLFGQKI